MANRNLIFPMLLAVLAFQIGCGRPTKVYNDPISEPMTGTEGILTEADNVLPHGLHDHSANRAEVDSFFADGQTTIRFRTFGGTNTEGAFGGNGTGNLALLGLANHSGEALSTLSTISFDAKILSGNDKFSLAVLVDLECNGTTPRVLLASSDDLDPGLPVEGAYNRFTASINNEQWSVSGSSITDPSNSSTVLISSSTDSSPKSLQALLTSYPNACIANDSSGDANLPRNLPTSGVLLSFGSSDTAGTSEARVVRITIGSTKYESSNWEKP